MAYDDALFGPAPKPRVGLLTPVDDQEEEEKKRLLAEAIQAEEEETGLRSKLRDLLPTVTKPSEGIDLPPSYSLHDLPEGEGSYYAPDETPRPPSVTHTEESPLRRAVSDFVKAQRDENVAPEGSIDEITGVPTGPVRQAAQGVVSSALSMPWLMGGAIESLWSVPAKAMGYEGPGKAAEWMFEKAKSAEGLAQSLIRGGEPQGAAQKAARMAGESFTPAGTATAPLTGAMTGVRAVQDWMSQEPSAPDWSGSTFTTPAEGATPKLAPEEKERRLQERRQKALQKKEERAKQKYQERDTRTTQIVDSIGGPVEVNSHELYTMGGMVAASIGMIFAPKIYSKFKQTLLPRLPTSFQTGAPRPVREAAPGTKAISTPGDLGRTYDEAAAGAIRLAERAGSPEAVVKQLEDGFRIQTRASAHSLGEAAINEGTARSISLTFQTRTPLADIAKLDTAQVSRYLYLRQTFDDLNIASQQSARNPGPTILRGQTMQDVFTEINAIEQAMPAVRRISQAFNQNTKDLRKFLSTGEYATLSKREAAYQNSQQPNRVPFKHLGENDIPVLVDRAATNAMTDSMRAQIRHRVENEVVGMYVDAMIKVNPNLFVEVLAQDLKRNPSWQKNTVTFYRGGKAEHYTTDPFLANVLNLDPYYLGSAGSALYASRRMLEMTTTGALAPLFAITSALRNWQISKFTAPTGMRSSTLFGTVAAIPEQLLPQMARYLSRVLENNSGGWLGTVLGGQGNVNALSTRLAAAYDNSLYAMLQTVGTYKGSILQQQYTTQQVAGMNALLQAANSLTGPAAEFGRTALQGYHSLLHSVHNAPAYNFARRNRNLNMSLQELAMHARRLTGDPSVGGQFYTSGGRAIRFVNEQNRVSHTAGQIVKGYGYLTEQGRNWVPWWNATTQGIKRIGEAYLENPAKFVGHAWMYSIAPAAASYLMSRAFDKDPSGLSYVDYQMNRRSDYAKSMYWYIPIPGRPAEEGIEIPRFHEMSIISRLTEVGMDHAFRSSFFTEKEDFEKALSSFIDVAVKPPTPPIFNLFMAQFGLVGPQGAFGGEAYRKREEPFDQTRGFSVSTELYIRSIGGGIADIVGSMYAAFTQTPEGMAEAARNALVEGGKRFASKGVLLRDITGTKAPISGNTPIVEELFKKEKEIDTLSRFYDEWTRKSGAVDVKPKSIEGGMIADKLLGSTVPSELAGLAQPEPTNPLYTQFAEQVWNKFKKEAPVNAKGEDQGAIGFKSLWDRYRDATKQIRSMQNINEGNRITWQKQLDARPQQLAFIRDHGVDPSDAKQVRNMYEKIRHDSARVILQAIRSVEKDMSAQLGQEITIKDLHPYKGLGGKPAGVTDSSYAVP